MRRWTVMALIAVVGLALLALGGTSETNAAAERSGPFDIQIKALAMNAFDGDDDDDDDSDSDSDAFQLAFISRVDTDSVQADGTSLLLGYAESLQAPVPGVVLGAFEETIGALCGDVEDLPECPSPGNCVPICDTVTTAEGSLTYQALVMVLVGSASGPFSTSSVFGQIVGGTGAYEGAAGSITLAGQINICTTPGDGAGCAISDGVPAGLGLRYDCHFILRGTLGNGG